MTPEERSARRKGQRKLVKVYAKMRQDMACTEAEHVGKKRRGRKKNKVLQFPYPKRGKHRVVDGITVPAAWAHLKDSECFLRLRGQGRV